MSLITCITKANGDGCNLKKFKGYSSKISSDLGNVKKEVEDIISYLRESYASLTEDTVFETRVVLNELIINAIKHGNKEDPCKHIMIDICVDDMGYAEFTLEDEGKGYDHKIQKCADINKQSDLCELNETGRGLIIVTSLCDSVIFNDAGNRIVVRKKLNIK